MENLNKRPSKGILRFSEGSSRSNSVEKDIRWDENNIKETLHPDDKDYGFMKIDEPPTPYSRSPHGHSADNSDDEDLQNKTDELLARVSKKIKEPPITLENVEGLINESVLDEIERQDSVDEDSINGSRRVKIDANSAMQPTTSSSSNLEGTISNERGGCSSSSDFELKRKRHYNEFHAVKLAKKLMEQELNADEDDDEDGSNQSKQIREGMNNNQGGSREEDADLDEDGGVYCKS